MDEMGIMAGMRINGQRKLRQQSRNILNLESGLLLLLGALLWGKWGLFELQSIQALRSSVVWCNGVARGVS